MDLGSYFKETRSEEPVTSTTLTKEPEQQISSTDIGLSASLFLGLMSIATICWALIALVRSKSPVFHSSIMIKNRSMADQISLSQIHCRKCYFFTSNSYVKCAVHPSRVLTEQAINCPDYKPKDP
jgi:hypothetical protein